MFPFVFGLFLLTIKHLLQRISDLFFKQCINQMFYFCGQRKNRFKTAREGSKLKVFNQLLKTEILKPRLPRFVGSDAS